jgi:hypothetical protein
MWAETAQLLPSDAEIAATLAADFALVGDVAHARELAKLSRPQTPDREIGEAVLAWRAGDAASAIARLKALDAVEPASDWGLPPSFVLAEIASSNKEDVTVLEAARRFHSLWGELGSHGGWTVPRMLFLEAQSLSRLGRTSEARALVDRVLTQMAKAESGDPLVQALLALRAHL